jgi:hypothetical protein
MKMKWMLPSLLALALGAPAALASIRPALQDGAKPVEEKPPTEKPVVPPPPIQVGPTSEEEAAHAEIERLFGEVERKMSKVNRLLEEASAGGRRPQEASRELDSAIRAIDELLRDTEASSRAAVEGIDKILELADHEHSGGT